MIASLLTPIIDALTRALPFYVSSCPSLDCLRWLGSCVASHLEFLKYVGSAQNNQGRPKSSLWHLLRMKVEELEDKAVHISSNHLSGQVSCFWWGAIDWCIKEHSGMCLEVWPVWFVSWASLLGIDHHGFWIELIVFSFQNRNFLVLFLWGYIVCGKWFLLAILSIYFTI